MDYKLWHVSHKYLPSLISWWLSMPNISWWLRSSALETWTSRCPHIRSTGPQIDQHIHIFHIHITYACLFIFLKFSTNGNYIPWLTAYCDEMVKRTREFYEYLTAKPMLMSKKMKLRTNKWSVQFNAQNKIGATKEPRKITYFLQPLQYGGLVWLVILDMPRPVQIGSIFWVCSNRATKAQRNRSPFAWS